MRIEPDTLRAFVRQSLQIEGIHRDPTDRELELHNQFLSIICPTVDQLQSAVSVLEPGARLRDVKDGGGVRVGRHRPKPNGPEIRTDLEKLLSELMLLSSHELYCRYESIHPFTDGNGRSGRLLWLWRVVDEPEGWHALLHPGRSFLEVFHYQTLDAHDSRKG